MALNIFPRRKEPIAIAAPESLAILPEPSAEALEDLTKRPTRRGTRGGRGRKRPGEGLPESEDSAGEPELVAEPVADKPVRARRPRAAAAPSPAPSDDNRLAAEAEPVETAAAPRAARVRAVRPKTEVAPVTAAAAGGTDITPLVRAIEQQGRQLEQVMRAQEDPGRRGPAAAPPQSTATQARVGIFVDAANIELACDRLRARFDWSKIMAMLTQNRQLVRAISYAPVHEDLNVSLETQRFAEPFLGRGYKVVTKPLKRFQDGSVKANVDIEIAVDVLEMLDRLDVVCLVSGDGDFQYLVEAVQKKGVRVEVIAVGASTATNLRNAADHYIDLQTKLAQIRA
jgi:uncharacterized LabA/DUF88 family protein